MKTFLTDLRINHLVWLIVISLIVKVGFYLTYTPGIYSDTSGYVDLARIILTNSWDAFDGLRTPGYPGFLILLSLNPYLVTAVQSLLGLGVVILVFMIGKSVLENTTLAFWLGLLCLGSVNTLFMDMTLLTESLTTFLLVLLIFLSLYLLKSNPLQCLWLSTSLGTVVGLAFLVRPNLLILAPIIFMWVIYVVRYKFKSSLRWQTTALSVFLLPMLLAYVGWSAVSLMQFDTFQYSNASGIYLTSHTGSFIELADDEHAMIRDRVLERRYQGYMEFYDILYPTASGIAHHKAHAAEWYVAGDLVIENQIYSLADVNELFLNMNMDLIQDYPLLYIESVYEAFIRYGLGENLVLNSNFRMNGLGMLFNLVWMVQVIFIRTAFLLVYLISVLMVLSLIKREKSGTYMLMLMTCLVIAFSGLFQALAINVANNRMGLPFQPLVFLVVVYGVSELKILGKLPMSNIDK